MRTFIELYEYLRVECTDLITFLENSWKGKDKQESVFRLFAYLGLFQEFEEFIVCDGNFNKFTLKDGRLRELMKASLKDKGDLSDLTLWNSTHIIASTSKNHAGDYGIGNLDLREIIQLYSDNTIDLDTPRELRICIVVRDKRSLIKKCERAESTSRDLVDIIRKAIVLDWSSLVVAYERFMFNYAQVPISELLAKESNKPFMLRFHQKIAVDKARHLTEIGHNRILIGCIPRSGKSYIMAGIIMREAITNCLIITTAPNETIQQYLDMFHSYEFFCDYKIFHLNATSKSELNTLGGKNIIICSKQYLQKKDLTVLKEVPFEIRFFDESHHGGTTQLAKDIVDGYSPDAITFFMTATYAKPIQRFSIPLEAQITWDLEDVKLCKDEGNDARIVEKHGVVCPSGYYEDYQNFPELNFITWHLKPGVKSTMMDMVMGTEYGISLDSMFLLAKGKKKFANESMMDALCASIFGKVNTERGISMETVPDAFMHRVKSIVDETGSRWFSQERPLIIMCFLPVNLKGSSIEAVSIAFEPYVRRFLPDFNVVSINSKANNGKNPRSVIDSAYAETVTRGKLGLVVLSGKQCTLGVTISECDIVILLSNVTSFDSIYQTMFRAMTEARDKRSAFVIDLNFQRVISVMVDYAMKVRPELSIANALEYSINQRLITLNGDEWVKDYFEFKDISDRIYQIWTSNVSISIKQMMRMIDFHIDLPDSARSILGSIFKSTNTKVKIENVGADIDVPDGISVTSNGSSSSSVKKEDNEVDLMKDVIGYVLPLFAILTIKSSAVSFEEMAMVIEATSQLKEIALTQFQCWWGDTGKCAKTNPNEIFDVIIGMAREYFSNNEEFAFVVKRVKELFSMSLGDNSKLSQLIDDHLVPHELEKKKNAEVSTPRALRQEMLDKIPAEFWQGRQVIRKNPETGKPQKVRILPRIFEPCSGKAGFLIDIVDRLMKGLAKTIPNEARRYKMIVEDCLYWADINPVNVFIGKLLLDPRDEYDLKYHEGDTLQLDTIVKWGIDKFDAVIGNPPYNDASGNKGKGHTLWDRFLIFALDTWLAKDGYICYIHPASWRQVDSPILDKFKERYLIYLEIHNVKDGLENFNCSTRYDWYVLKNTPNADKLETIIVDEDGISRSINLNAWRFIPNKCLEQISLALAGPHDETLEVFCYRSAYGADKSWVSKTENNVFKYPVVYSINKENELSLRYSNTKDNGHFGLCKFIFSNGAGFYCDVKGEYGLTQWAYCIYDNAVNVRHLEHVFRSDAFKDIREGIHLDSSTYNIKALKLFKKDFWNHIQVE